MRSLFLSRKKELRRLSKNELIDLIFSKDEKIDSLEARLKKIEHYLKAFDNAHTPSSKQLKKNTKDQESQENNSSKDESDVESSDEDKKKIHMNSAQEKKVRARIRDRIKKEYSFEHEVRRADTGYPSRAMPEMFPTATAATATLAASTPASTALFLARLN